MSDLTSTLSHRHGEFVDGHGNPLPFALFSLDDAGIEQFIEHCTRDDAQRAAEQEAEHNADLDFIRRMEAIDKDAAAHAIQARQSDLPAAMTLNEVANAFGVEVPSTTTEKLIVDAVQAAAVADPAYAAMLADVLAELSGAPAEVSTSMKQAEVLGKAIDAVLNPLPR